MDRTPVQSTSGQRNNTEGGGDRQHYEDGTPLMDLGSQRIRRAPIPPTSGRQQSNDLQEGDRRGVLNNIQLLDLEPNLPELDRSSLLDQSTYRSRSFMDLSKVLPSFDPVVNDMDVNRWIEKIEEYSEMYRWDDLATRHYALSKLEGVAKKWKDSLEKANRSWNDWKELLKKNFLSEETGMREVLDAQNYKRRHNQNITEYFYEKLAKCNRARMGKKESMEWIIDGLDDSQYRAYLGPLSRYAEPADLLPDLKSGSTFIKNSVR